MSRRATEEATQALISPTPKAGFKSFKSTRRTKSKILIKHFPEDECHCPRSRPNLSSRWARSQPAARPVKEENYVRGGQSGFRTLAQRRRYREQFLGRPFRFSSGQLDGDDANPPGPVPNPEPIASRGRAQVSCRRVIGNGGSLQTAGSGRFHSISEGEHDARAHSHGYDGAPFPVSASNTRRSLPQ